MRHVTLVVPTSVIAAGFVPAQPQTGDLVYGSTVTGYFNPPMPGTSTTLAAPHGEHRDRPPVGLLA